MFEQHPVPQNISSYQFRLVGDMTITQFFQLAGGALIALLIYSLPLPGIFKWPMIIFCVLGGAALAFLPFQERPLAMWIGAFMRSIYSPTVYIWQKLDSYQFFAPEEGAVQPQAQDTTVQPQIDPTNPAHVANLEEGEKTTLAKISHLFTFGGSRTNRGQAAPTSKPQDTTMSNMDNSALKQPIDRVAQPTQAQTQAQAPGPKQVVVPQQQPTNIAVATYEPPAELAREPIQVTEEELKQTFSGGGQNAPSVQAKFSTDAAPPTPPERPNIIVGQIMDANGKIIEGAILEIKDEQGRPVRALKTNNAGHFLIVTPLNNGKYTIITEKEGYEFDNIHIEAKGEIIEPIAIRAK